MFQADPARLELAAEFKAHPFGPHSGDLHRLLNLMRAEPLPGRLALLTIVPHRQWALVRLGPPRGGAFEILEGVRYHSPAEAEWDVFRRRWQAITGQALSIE